MFRERNLRAYFTPPRWLEVVSSPTFSITSVAALLVFGFVLDHIEDNDWFARMGALTTLFAVFLVWASLRTEHRLNQLEFLLLSNLPGDSRGFNQVINQSKLNRLFGGSYQLKTSELDSLVEAAPKILSTSSKLATSAMNHQFGLVTVGTIAWAFGDMLL